jgi:uncharacterized protein YutE (UPF0331/DUF86 family)
VSPIDAAIVRAKLGHVMTSLDLLRPMRAMPLADYRARVWERKGIERVLQEAIEAALDINAHVIAERGLDVPDDYFGGFIKLGEIGILSAELAAALAPSAGLTPTASSSPTSTPPCAPPSRRRSAFRASASWRSLRRGSPSRSTTTRGRSAWSSRPRCRRTPPLNASVT